MHTSTEKVPNTSPTAASSGSDLNGQAVKAACGKIMDRIRPLAARLLGRAEDANDHNLPLMYWYAAEPFVGKDTKNAIALLGKTKIAKVRTFITRRMTAGKNVAAGK